jgi:hypothetical protein
VLSHVDAAMQVLRSEEQLVFTQLLHADVTDWPVMAETAPSGLVQPPPLLLLPLPPPEPPLELPPSSPSLEASSPLKLPLPLLFEPHAIAAPNEPTITAVHATDLSITASLKVRRSMQDGGDPINGANTVLLQ